MTCFFASPSFPPSPSFYIRHLAIVLRKHSRASCLPTYVRKGVFSHGAAGENWDSLCSLRDAICPCCLRGVLSPLLLPLSIHPTLCPSTPRCSLMLIYRAESPRNVVPISPLLLFSSLFSPCPITNSFPALSLFIFLPPSHPLCVLSSSPHPFVTHLSLFLINHPFMTPVEKIIKLSYIYDEPSENLVILF